MRLEGANEDTLTIQVDGYQFPDAADPQQRYSWHMVAGEARSAYGTWSFRWQALTCDESPRVSKWLRDVADWVDLHPGHEAGQVRFLDRPKELQFTEPNLQFRIAGELAALAVIRVDLDLEFRPPWHLRPGRYCGDEYSLRLLLTSRQLRDAADEWDSEIAGFPDLLTTPPP